MKEEEARDDEYEQEEFVGRFKERKQKEKKIMVEVLKEQAI